MVSPLLYTHYQKKHAPRRGRKLIQIVAIVTLIGLSALHLRRGLPNSTWSSRLQLNNNSNNNKNNNNNNNNKSKSKSKSNNSKSKSKSNNSDKNAKPKASSNNKKKKGTTETASAAAKATDASTTTKTRAATTTTTTTTKTQLADNKEEKEKVATTAAKSVKVLRQAFEKKCRDKSAASKDLDAVRKDLVEPLSAMFTPPSTLPKLDEIDPVEPCKYTFIDLGANVGDSLGKFIDAGFPANCTGLDRMKSWPRYSIEYGNMTIGDPTDLVEFVRTCLNKEQSLSKKQQQQRQPEDYCYVGVEGNPVFTSGLKELEARIMGTIPKPVKAAHFYTETVATKADGPTVLYLDTVNQDRNFRGSSIIESHPAVQKSAIANGNITVEAQVAGMTLSTLLERSVKRVQGAHVLIKIDIEGGEFIVLNEAINTLCNFTNAGVQVNLIFDMHPQFLMSEKEKFELKRFRRATAKRLDACNISQAEFVQVNIKKKKQAGKKKKTKKSTMAKK